MAAFELDYAGVGEILRSPEMAAAVAEAAGAVAAELNQRGVATVYVDHYVTDRAAASVTVPASRASELVSGRLLDAATRAGLDVRGHA